MSDSTPISNILIVVLAIFMTMKILGIMPVAAWSWWLVFSPLWIGFIMFLTFILIAGIIFVVYKLLT